MTSLQKLFGFLSQLLPVELNLHHLQKKSYIIVVQMPVLLQLRNLGTQILNFHDFFLLLGVFTTRLYLSALKRHILALHDLFLNWSTELNLPGYPYSA
jgi:hypothetical protein